MSSEFISVNEACLLLGMSRPTFGLKRETQKLKEFRRGKQILFKKNDILNKIYRVEKLEQETVDLLLLAIGSFSIKDLLVDDYTLDLRKVRLIDSTGVIALLGYVMDKLKDGHNIFFIIDRSNAACVQLEVNGFFKELSRKYSNLVHWSLEELTFSNDHRHSLIEIIDSVFLPLREITYRGQERKVLDGLLLQMLEKGFSEEKAGYVGWIIGELSDNSLTHAKGPCYISCSRYTGSEGGFIQIAVSDLGVGVHKSLKTNEAYSELSDRVALLKSFQSQVSSWPDSAQRGKGLCDLLTIALGNGGFVRVDTKECALLFNFTGGQRSVDFIKPLSENSGSRFSIFLREVDFEPCQRIEIDTFILREIDRYGRS